jgi:hypothetical protein
MRESGIEPFPDRRGKSSFNLKISRALLSQFANAEVCIMEEFIITVMLKISIL